MTRGDSEFADLDAYVTGQLNAAADEHAAHTDVDARLAAIREAVQAENASGTVAPEE